MKSISRRQFIQSSAVAATGAAVLTSCATSRSRDEKGMVFPGTDWRRCAPEEMDLDSVAIDRARDETVQAAGDGPHSAVVIRYGRLVAEWYHQTTPDQQQPMASVCKSVFCSMLGIAVAEGRIHSIDDRLVDYYPEMMECSGEFGANTKQFVTEKDRAVTFRQVAAQIDGFMQPDEPTGKVFHYRTFNMAAMMHAIAKSYGFYDAPDPQSKPGDGELIAQKLRDPIGGTWSWKYMNFKFPETAKYTIFMNYPHLQMTTRDMARIGHLWLNGGRWAGRAVIPAVHQRDATHVPEITRANIAPENWKYGYGLWLNEFGRLWPNLPRDSYTAAGAGGRLIWVCPSLGLVVAQNPAVPNKDFFKLVLQGELQERVLAACRGS